MAVVAARRVAGDVDPQQLRTRAQDGDRVVLVAVVLRLVVVHTDAGDDVVAEVDGADGPREPGAAFLDALDTEHGPVTEGDAVLGGGGDGLADESVGQVLLGHVVDGALGHAGVLSLVEIVHCSLPLNGLSKFSVLQLALTVEQ